MTVQTPMWCDLMGPHYIVRWKKITWELRHLLPMATVEPLLKVALGSIVVDSTQRRSGCTPGYSSYCQSPASHHVPVEVVAQRSTFNAKLSIITPVSSSRLCSSRNHCLPQSLPKVFTRTVADGQSSYISHSSRPSSVLLNADRSYWHTQHQSR